MRERVSQCECVRERCRETDRETERERLRERDSERASERGIETVRDKQGERGERESQCECT